MLSNTNLPHDDFTIWGIDTTYLEEYMARPKGSKNKTVEEKVEDMVQEVTDLLPKASEAQAAEIVEAVKELEDIIDLPTKEVELPTKEVEEKKLVGYHPVTKEPVYL